MKTIHFFTRRKGLPILDFGYTARFLHLSLQRAGYVWCCSFIWAGIVAAFAAGALLLMQWLERTLVPPFPTPHALGVLALIVPVLVTVVVVVWLRSSMLIRVLGDLLLVAGGMPAGVEGAAMRLGALDVAVKHFSDAERELLKVCGFTAALAGLFGTPLAAVVFTLVFVTMRKPMFVITAAVTGKAVHYVFTGNLAPVIKFPHLDMTLGTLGVYILLGIFIGLVAGLTVWGTRALQGLVSRRPSLFWPVAGAVAVGLIAWLKPDAYGQGFEKAELMFAVKNITIALLIAMSGYKTLALAAARGTGMQGSIISPLLVMGAGWGLLAALLLQLGFPEVPLDPPTAALIGAAALLAGVTRGWLPAVVLVVEMSGRLDALAPVALAGGAAYLVAAVFLQRDASMPEALQA